MAAVIQAEATPAVAILVAEAAIPAAVVAEAVGADPMATPTASK
jgi:hypothetical protein